VRDNKGEIRMEKTKSIKREGYIKALDKFLDLKDDLHFITENNKKLMIDLEEWEGFWKKVEKLKDDV